MQVEAVLARGGSSRGLLIRADRLSGLSEEERRKAFAFAVGSPDPDGRQVNGVGGGNATTSKVAVISPSGVSGHHVEYEFYQIIVATGASERRGTCGNLVAAVAQYAIEEGMVAAGDPTTIVVIRDVNTGQTIEVEVPTPTGRVEYRGSHVLAGIPGAGAAILVRFISPGGRTTGEMLPSGALAETVDIDGSRYTVSLIDSVNPVVLVHADSLPANTPWSLQAIEAAQPLRNLLERIRNWAAMRFNLAEDEAKAVEQSPFLPFVGMYWDSLMNEAARPHSISLTKGADLSVRLMSGGLPHRAVPLSAGLATASLARLRAVRAGAPEAEAADIRLEHPSGLLDVRVDAISNDIRSVGVTLTARRIMSGTVELG